MNWGVLFANRYYLCNDSKLLIIDSINSLKFKSTLELSISFFNLNSLIIGIIFSSILVESNKFLKFCNVSISFLSIALYNSAEMLEKYPHLYRIRVISLLLKN